MSIAGSRGDRIKYIFGAVGAIIGFIVGNWDKLLDIILGTSITITTGSDLGKLDSSYKIQIKGLTSGTTQFGDSITLDAAARGFEVTPGVYTVAFVRGQDVLSSKNEAVSRGSNQKITFDRTSIEDAWQKQHKIGVRMELDAKQYAPGQPIGLVVTSTGIGYLWVEEFDASGNVKGSFPPPGQEGGNLIDPVHFVSFPSENKQGFSADADLGEYRLIALVTSSPKRTDTDKIFNEIRGVSTKSFGTVETNWGYAETSYAVRHGDPH